MKYIVHQYTSLFGLDDAKFTKRSCPFLIGLACAADVQTKIENQDKTCNKHIRKRPYQAPPTGWCSLWAQANTTLRVAILQVST